MPPPVVTLTFDLLTPKSNQHIYDPKYRPICDQNLVKFPSLVFDIWCSQGGTHRLKHSRTRSLTHSRTSVTDGQTRSQYVSGTVFQWWRRHNKFTYKRVYLTELLSQHTSFSMATKLNGVMPLASKPICELLHLSGA